MCILCHALVADEHWSDALRGGNSDAWRRRSVVASVLRAAGLELRAGTTAATWVVSDRKGRSSVVTGLGELWPAAEALAGRPLDPLDDRLLQRLP